MNQQELKNVLELHRKWVLGESDGRRADLRSANLRSADLSYANLRSADLRSANLSYANLSYANLRSADLSYANLRYANLSYANLSSAKNEEIRLDYFKVLSVAKGEAIALYKSLMEGKIDGSVYQGECACLVGTIANARNEHFEKLKIDLRPDSSRPIEKWFMGISKGDTPKNNPISELVSQWTEEFMKENDIFIPKMRTIWE